MPETKPLEARVPPAKSKEPLASQRRLAIDARMLFSSGIGRYLREVLARRPDWATGRLVAVCNSDEQTDWAGRNMPDAVVVRSRATIYSLREQFQALGLPKHSLYWVPHYNVPFLSRAPVVVTVHDVAPLALPDAFGGLAKRLAARFFFGAVRAKARRIIAVSNATRAEIIAHKISGAERISVIPNGVGSYWFEGAPMARLPRTILFVGNLKPHKNLARLLQAAEEVRRQEPIELVIAGKISGFRTGLKDSLIEKLLSTPWIRVLGETSDAELRSLYSQSTMFVLPSMYEGFGLPVLEAMAGGCPVVLSNIPALVEVAGPSRAAGGIAEYFDPVDARDMGAAILRLLRTDDAEKARMSREGMAHAAGYSWDRTAKATWAVLADLLQ